MEQRRIAQIARESLPFLSVFIAQQFGNELLTTAAVILATAITLRLRYYKNEVALFVFGVCIGLIIELGLGLIYREQFWANASLWGIPIWLPLVWGYGFIVIRRVGNLIVLER